MSQMAGALTRTVAGADRQHEAVHARALQTTAAAAPRLADHALDLPLGEQLPLCSRKLQFQLKLSALHIRTASPCACPVGKAIQVLFEMRHLSARAWYVNSRARAATCFPAGKFAVAKLAPVYSPACTLCQRYSQCCLSDHLTKSGWILTRTCILYAPSQLHSW